MRAAVLQAPRRVEVMEVATPESAGEVSIRIEATGICGSDLHAVHGRHPFRHPPVILGHEGAGTVVRVPSADCPVRPGDRVAIMPSVSCWRCRRCEAGQPQLCPHKRVPGKGWTGLLAEYTTAPARVLYPLADAIGMAEGAMIEPAAVAWRATRGAGIVPGRSVAVLGAGAIGALIAKVCQLHGAGPLMISDVKDYNLAFARGLGATAVVNAAREDVVAAGTAVSGDDGFDAVIVASGHASCLDEALSLCRPGGTVVVLPMFGGALAADFNRLVLKEIRLQGSTTYTPGDFRAAAELVNTRRLDVRPFVTQVAPLSQVPDIFASIEDGLEYMKIQFDPSR
ncbi:MAG TPA: alcohol dehydrogenase catalytic domain-containing protein [Trebonia sp.]|jgi:L-iditol 2-dehydrogenase|nr:alcohol dehydrogenase catalytic domain-containing protein [Trebonia sp.]